MPELHTLQFCGNLGDPLAAKNFDEQMQYAVENKKVENIIINTNGSLRSKDWWKNLATFCNEVNLQVWFAIDGNKTNHSYYRQGTNYDKIIENATAFINNGGQAVWQYILFHHNKNNLIECFNKSQELGFTQFKVIKNVRSDQASFHYRTGESLDIKNYTENTVISNNEKHDFVYKKNCMHISYPSMYLAANGKIHPCCYLYGENVSQKNVADSFDNKNFLSTCLKSCGHIESSVKTIH
jgi:hypothetical protein